MLLVALLVTDSPYARERVARIKMRALARSLRLVWGNPGTRLGMWSHFTSQFSGTVFALLWGYPFLVRGEGLSPDTASTLLMLMTGWIIVSGLVLGTMVSRFPFYRSWMVLGIVAAMALGVGRRARAVDPRAVVDAGGAGLPDGDRRARPRWSASTSPARSCPSRPRAARTASSTSAASPRACSRWALIGVVLDWHSGGGGRRLRPRRLPGGDVGAGRSSGPSARSRSCATAARRSPTCAASIPGAVEALKRGEPVAHLGFHEREGV